MSKVTLVFEAENSADLCKQVCAYVDQHAPKNTVTAASAVKEAEKSSEAVEKPPAEKPAAKKAVKKEAKPAPVEEPADEEADEVEDNPFDSTEEAEPEGEALTFDKVNAKLEAVGKSPKGGISKVKEILKSVGLAKVKEIQDEHFAAIVKACDKVLA